MIDFICPACRKKYRVADDTAGKKVRCRGCGARLRVAGPGEAKLLPPKGDPLSAPVGAVNLGDAPAASPPPTAVHDDGFKELPPDPAPASPAPAAGPAPSAAASMTSDLTPRQTRTGGWILVGIGIAILAGGAFWVKRTNDFVGSAASAKGTVVEMVEHRDDRGKSLYSPRVRFQTQDGKDREFTSTVGSNPPSFRTGEEVEILYDAASPAGAVIKAFSTLWLFPIAVCGAGLFLAGVGAAVMLGLIQPKPTGK